MKTKATSATKRRAVARPIPLLPPVMTATFSSSLLMNFLLIDFLFLAADGSPFTTISSLRYVSTRICGCRGAQRKGLRARGLKPHPLQKRKTQRVRHPKSRCVARLKFGGGRKFYPPAVSLCRG